MLPVAARQLGQPAFDAGCERLDAPILPQDHQSRGLWSIRVSSLADEEPTAGALREIRRDVAQEAQLIGGEQGLPLLAIETQHAPGVSCPGTQSDEQLLLHAKGTHVEVVARA